MLFVVLRFFDEGRCSARAIGDTRFAQIVGGEFDFDFVAGENTNVVFAHLAGNVRGDHVTIFQAHPKGGVGKGVDYFTFHFDLVFFRHAAFTSNLLGVWLSLGLGLGLGFGPGFGCRLCGSFCLGHASRAHLNMRPAAAKLGAFCPNPPHYAKLIWGYRENIAAIVAAAAFS
jgi:hypothetical protein